MNKIDHHVTTYFCGRAVRDSRRAGAIIRPETLAEMRDNEAVEFYSRERILELSQKV